MDSYAYYNGKFGKINEITIPLSDRSIFFADAVYDAAIGVYDRILWEEEHIDRFMSNAVRIGITPGFTKKYLSELLREIAVKSMIKSYFLYFQISRDLPVRSHSPLGAKSNLLITVTPIDIKQRSTPLRLVTVQDKRHGYCDIKTTNLLPSVLASCQAEMNGYDEAIFVRRGVVTECAKSNISILSQGRIITHPESAAILPGITRKHLKLVCNDIGIEFCEEKFSVKDMLAADEVLVTGTSKLCKKAGSINGITVGGRDGTTADALCDLIYREYSSYCTI